MAVRQCRRLAAARSTILVQAYELTADGISVAVDYLPAIAHNKVMVIDESLAHPIAITGSFNFTARAEYRNAENLLVITGD